MFRAAGYSHFFLHKIQFIVGCYKLSDVICLKPWCSFDRTKDKIECHPVTEYEMVTGLLCRRFRRYCQYLIYYCDGVWCAVVDILFVSVVANVNRLTRVMCASRLNANRLIVTVRSRVKWYL